ncbi:MAG: molybdopterin-dependent oxidoreductase, partial [Raoultibacter sp.]
MGKTNKQLTRRSFLATTTLAAGALAATGAAGCSRVDTSGGGAEEAVAPEETYHMGTCRGNCGGRCALKATVREGKIVSTMPLAFPRENEGVQVGCMKGVTNPLRIYGTHRLMYPMKRAGARGSGEWERISWDEAIQTIADKFKAAVDEYGPASVCFQTGAGNMYSYLQAAPVQMWNSTPSFGRGFGISRLVQKMGATMLGVGDDMAGIIFAFFLLKIPTNALEDIQHAKTIIAWGANPAEASFARSAWHWISKAKENGAKLVTIDPLYTSTAAGSDVWMPIRVGTDSALMCAMANYIIENDLVNWEYVKNKSVAPLLINETGAYLRLSDLGKGEKGSKTDVPVVWDEASQDFVAHSESTSPAIRGTFDANGTSVRTVFDAALESIEPFTVEFAANECGLPAAQIEEIARLCATETPTTFYINYGLEHTYESWRVYFASSLLAALTGNVGIPGGSYRGSISLDHPVATMFKKPVKNDLSLLKVEDAKPVKVITGDYLVEIMETGKWAGEDFPVRAMIVQTCDPLDNFSGPSALIKAYEKIDFICTIELTMTTMAHYSDMVLPAAFPWESEEFTDGGIYTQKAIEPLGEAKPDFDIMRDIAKAMGYTDLFPMEEGVEYLRSMLDTPENIEAGVGFDDYRENGVILGDYSCEIYQSPEVNELGRTQ